MNYFDTPHGGRPPSDEAVRAQTLRYCRAEAQVLFKSGTVERYNEFVVRMSARYGADWYSPDATPAAPEQGEGAGNLQEMRT